MSARTMRVQLKVVVIPTERLPGVESETKLTAARSAPANAGLRRLTLPGRSPAAPVRELEYERPTCA